MAERSFSERDLRRWAEQGLITRDQLGAILAAEAEGVPPDTDAREGINLPTISYYLGASLALIAIGVFAGINWADASEEARLAIIAASVAAIGGAGFYAVEDAVPARRQRPPDNRRGYGPAPPLCVHCSVLRARE